MGNGCEVVALLEVLNGKGSISTGKAQDYLYQIGREMGIVATNCYDLASHQFDSEKAVTKIVDEFGAEVPLYIFSVWIKEHPDDGRYDVSARRQAERIVESLGDKMELFEYINLDPIHPVLLNELYKRFCLLMIKDNVEFGRVG